jgi:hypothetical protein
LMAIIAMVRSTNALSVKCWRASAYTSSGTCVSLCGRPLRCRPGPTTVAPEHVISV